MENQIGIFLQTVAAIFSALAAFAAYKQCKLMKNQLDGDRYLRQNDKSIELARLFADEILPKSSYIAAVLKASNTAMSIATKLKTSHISEFDSDEFSCLINHTPQEALTAIMGELTTKESIAQIHASRTLLTFRKPSDAFPIRITHEAASNSDRNDDNADEFDKEQMENFKAIDLMLKEFDHVTTNTLNCLEYFCMAINSEIADDEVLYPSLHQIFFSTVESLYVFICRSNDGNLTDRYYTHIKDLYTRWQEKHESDKKRLNKYGNEVQSRYKRKKRNQLR